MQELKIKDFSADELFAEMDKHYGMSLVTSEIDYLRFLNYRGTNKIYDYYTEGLTSGQRVLNKKNGKKLELQLLIEKNIFLGELFIISPTWLEKLKRLP